jgi:TRAP-type uncharacterized transport system fused permease subunit
MNEIIFDIIKNIMPALIVFLTVYVMLDKQAKKEERLKLFELKKRHSKESLPIRLQAYERLMLLMYRISPENIIPRTQNASMDVKMFTFTLLKTIKTEFEHNITQQVYVSAETWNAIELYRDELMSLIQEKSKELNPKEPCLQLSEAILNHLIASPLSVSKQEVVSRLKKEVNEVFI